jgi:cytochrome P450
MRRPVRAGMNRSARLVVGARRVVGNIKVRGCPLHRTHPGLFSNFFGTMVANVEYFHTKSGSADVWDIARRRGPVQRARVGLSLSEDNLIDTDPPRHTAMRKVANSCSPPRALARMEDEIRKWTREALGRIEAGVEVNFVDAVSRDVPLMVIADLLGVAREDIEKFAQCTDLVIGLSSDSAHDNPAAMLEELREKMAPLLGYFAERIEERRHCPMSDVVTAVVEGEGVLS